MADKNEKRKRKRVEKRKLAKQREQYKKDKKLAFYLGFGPKRAPLNDLETPAVSVRPTIQAQVGGVTTTIPLDQIKSSVVRHETLSPAIVDCLDAVYELIGRYLAAPQSREAWIDGFRYDVHPEQEVAVWVRICLAWRKYHDLYLDGIVRPQYETRLVAALLGISMGADSLPVPPTVALRLAQCYKDPLGEESGD